MESGQGGEEKAVLDLDDPQLEEKLVSELKAQGVFDQFRKDCLSDVDTKVRETSLVLDSSRHLASHPQVFFGSV